MLMIALKYLRKFTLLKSQLFSCARDLVRAIDSTLLESEDRDNYVVRAIHKIDRLTHSDVYVDFNSLLTARRGETKSFKNHEGRFEALVSTSNSHGNTIALPECLMAFLLFVQVQCTGL